ncbi:MAG: radical SAM protein [Candidatus Wallbacteria bacterium]|nr:radical SAM protein [Candidatus Wallbacteria bacterium]
MKVLLINPPSGREILCNNPRIVKEEVGCFPPLGLLYLGTILKNRGYLVSVLDAQVEKLTYQEIGKFIREYKPDVTGIIVMTFTLLDVLDTCRLVKKEAPSSRLVLGGPHVYIYPREAMYTTGADYAIMGEGEFSFPMLLENLDNFKELPRIPGLVYREGSDIRFGADPEFIEDLDSIPIPDRTLTPFRKYSSLLSINNPVTTMFTSRGCPYRCSFCDRPHLGKRFRAHSAGYVISEMEACERLGIKEILVYDDTFTIDRKRVIDVCMGYLERGLTIVWSIRSRVNTVDCEMLSFLKRANCQHIHFGVEAGTSKILHVLNKDITKEQALKAFRTSKQLGIETLAYFMIGAPSETEQDIRATFRFARQLAPDFMHLTILTPFPGTEIYRMGIERGLFPDFYQAFAADPRDSFTPRFWDAEIRESRLKELVLEGYKKFYFRPSYILSRLLRLKNARELWKKARAALKLFLWK